MRSRLLTIGLLIVAGVAAVGSQTPTRPPEPRPRSIVVLSDMRMGVGRDASGKWSSSEDFRWSDEFGAFLKAIDGGQGSAVDLILNGDTFELLQSGAADCQYSDPALGCTEAEAAARLGRVLTAHDAEIRALAAFARAGDNRIVFVPGDHDAALLFPTVAARLRRAVQAPPERVQVAMSGGWRSADGHVYAEHGHQLQFSPYALDNWPQPFVRRSGRLHLGRSWGERLVQPLYNRHEAELPLLDNVAEEGAGLKYALTDEIGREMEANAAGWLQYFLLKLSWSQFRQDADGGAMQAPEWDLAKVRAGGASFFLASLPDDDRLKPLVATAIERGRLASALDALTDDDLTAVCDYRAAVRRARRRMERVVTQFPNWGPPVAECARTPQTARVGFEYFWRSRALALGRRIRAVEAGAPAAPPIAVFVHGHTFLADPMVGGSPASNPDQLMVANGFLTVQNSLAQITINDGAWQRIVTPVQLDLLKEARGGSERELLRALTPDDLAPCYSFVQIEPYTRAPAPPVHRYWRQDEPGRWAMAANCGDAEYAPPPENGPSEVK